MTNQSITSRQIADAISILKAGGIVALPTETVYGLAARADDERAVAKIFTAKARPAINPLICHVASIEMAEEIAEMNATAHRLAHEFWPGPLTLVLPRTCESIVPSVTAGLSTIAIRMPNHPIMREIIAALGVPLAAPSANRSGRLSPTRAEHVARDMAGIVDMILDGGETDFGLESTVLAVRGDEVTLLRHGALAREEIERALGQSIGSETESSAPSSPGQLLRHYAPQTRLVLNSLEGQLQLGFGTGGQADLSPSANLQEAAHNLFAMLQTLDEYAKLHAIEEIHIAPIPNHGIGAAINDRLARAAASVEIK